MAVLCVYFGHLVGALGLAQIGSLGRFGVVMFFIHTSLVLMQSMDRLEVVAASKWKLLEGFWVRRLFRIYPLSILVVVVVACLHIPPDPNMAYHWMGARAFAANLALVQNLTTAPNSIAPLWSLPLEVQMYLLLPFAHLLLRGRRMFPSLGLWVASVPAAIFLPLVNWRLQVACFAPCFCAGVVAYDLLREQVPGERRLPAWIWPVGILAAIALFGPLDDVNLYHKLYRAWALALGLGVLYVYAGEGAGTGLFRVFHWIAEHSYGIYLSHIVLFWVVLRKMAGLPVWSRVAVLAVTSVLVPIALYRWVERPLMLAGAHLSRRLLRPGARELGAARPALPSMEAPGP